MRGSTSAGSKRVRSCRPDIRRLSLRSRGNRAPMANAFDRIGLVVHPSRVPSRRPWTRSSAGRHGAGVAGRAALPDGPSRRHGSAATPPPDATSSSPLGGDGTTLAALHAAAPVGRPVHGRRLRQPRRADRGPPRTGSTTRCERVAAGGSGCRALPGAARRRAGGEPLLAFNDLVLVRRGRRAGHRPRRGRRGARGALRGRRRGGRDAAGVLGLHARRRRADPRTRARERS